MCCFKWVSENFIVEWDLKWCASQISLDNNEVNRGLEMPSELLCISWGSWGRVVTQVCCLPASALSDLMPTFFHTASILMGASLTDILHRTLRIVYFQTENQVEMEMVLLSFTRRTRAWSSILTGSRFSHNSPDQELWRLSGCLWQQGRPEWFRLSIQSDPFSGW